MVRLPSLLLLALTLNGQAPQPNRDRHVIIISIDGLPAYALKDKTLPLPNLRRIAETGVAADSMQVVNPAVTWPNHTSIVTGNTPAKHTVLYNGRAERTGNAASPMRVEPWVEKPELVKGQTLYDLVHENKMTTAEVDWVAIHKAATIDYSFGEVPSLESKLVKEMIAAGKISEVAVNGFQKENIIHRDEIWLQAAEFIIEKHKPNLLLLHFLTTDSAQHRYGARSLGGNTALALVDSKLTRIGEAIRRAGIADATTVFVVSDHGFKTYTQTIRPNALLKQKGLSSDVWVIPEGGTAMLYILKPERRAELMPILREAFGAVSGVSKVLGPSDFQALGYPDPSTNNRMADLVLAAQEGYAFEGGADGQIVSKLAAGSTPGAHGYLSSDADMNAVFLAAGAGIRKGVSLGPIRNLDVAPTAAQILGLQMANTEGRVLTEILR